jgi:hypothetical protein
MTARIAYLLGIGVREIKRELEQTWYCKKILGLCKDNYLGI